MYEENEKSIFNYNMLFNKINSDNLDEKIDYNTNLISDINLQNFDIKRYEYYTNLLYIYNKDPATLYNLLKKYYNIKNFKSKERKIIKYISNYARLLKNNPDQEDTPPPGANKEDVTNVPEKLLTNAPPSSHTGGALEKYKKLIEELSTKIPTKKKRDDKKSYYTEKGTYVTDVVKKNTNAEVATAPAVRTAAAAALKLSAHRTPTATAVPDNLAARLAPPNPHHTAVPVDDTAAAAAAAAAAATAAAPVDDAASPPPQNPPPRPTAVLVNAAAAAPNRQHPPPPHPPHTIVANDISQDIVANDISQAIDDTDISQAIDDTDILQEPVQELQESEEYIDVPPLPQEQSLNKRLLKFAMNKLKKFTKNIQSNSQVQQQQQPNITELDIDEQLNLKLIELNKIFVIFQTNLKDFKFINENENYEIKFIFDINELKKIIITQPNYNEHIFMNFIDNLGSYTNQLIYTGISGIFNININIVTINIKYRDLFDFFSSLKKFLDYYFKIFGNNFLNIQNILNKSKFQKIILDLKSYIGEKDLKDKYILLEIYNKFRKLIDDLITELTPLNYGLSIKIHNEFNQDSNLVAVGGNLNDELKIKYLDTKKYKELKKTKKSKQDDEQYDEQDGKIDDLEPYKKYENDDDDDDMNKIGQLSEDIDNYYSTKENKDKKDKKDKDKFIIQQINNFENDPKNPLEELAITFDDRIVFIIATFFIRYITIIMVQWCIDINIIKTFYEGFIYYAIIYIIIFWFIVLFINIDNSFDVKYMNFNGIINSIRTLFYYFYMGTNGITRLLIHTSLIILLIIIPIILNIKNKTEFKDENEDEDVKILNYDERKQLSKTLSLFTMFIWLFTSIIATKF